MNKSERDELYYAENGSTKTNHHEKKPNHVGSSVKTFYSSLDGSSADYVFLGIGWYS